MENFNQAVVANNISDDEDSHIFRVFGLPRLVEQIILIKQSSTDVTSLELNDVVGNERAWNRLGCILGESIHVKELTIQNCSILDVLALGNGLRHNKCIHIMRFHRINLQNAELIKMSGLAKFWNNNPSLKGISISYCNLGPAGIDILSNALLNRSQDTLKVLCLFGNGFGDIDLSSLTVALVQCKQLRSLFLSSNGLGQKACASLVRLLEHQESNLQCLYLKNNSIDNNCAAMLSDALSTRRDEHGRVLSKNTALQSIHLYDNNMITKEGWMAMLKLICNTSSIEHVENSNHFLSSLGKEKSFYSVLGIDDANLLQSALKLNEDQTKVTVVRRKVIWSHARGCLNIGRSSIPTAAMPEVLSWFMDDFTNSNLIQYHDPLLPKSRLDTTRLDSVYRILKTRPVLCQYKEPNNNAVKLEIWDEQRQCQVYLEVKDDISYVLAQCLDDISYVLAQCLSQLKEKVIEIKHLRSEVKRTEKENSDLRGEIKRMEKKVLKRTEEKEPWQLVAIMVFAAMCGAILQCYLSKV